MISKTLCTPPSTPAALVVSCLIENKRQQLACAMSMMVLSRNDCVHTQD